MTSPQTATRSAPQAATKKPAGKPRPKKQPIGDRAKPQHAQDREQTIRLAAYALYEARGCTHGHALDDWLLAQAQLEQPAGTAALPDELQRPDRADTRAAPRTDIERPSRNTGSIEAVPHAESAPGESSFSDPPDSAGDPPYLRER